MNDIIPLFRFPAMRVLSIKGLKDRSLKARELLLASFSSITHLRIERSILTADSIRMLIALCPNLECFKYHYLNPSGACQIHFLNDCLVSRRGTLRTMWLDYYYGRQPLITLEELDTPAKYLVWIIDALSPPQGTAYSVTEPS